MGIFLISLFEDDNLYRKVFSNVKHESKKFAPNTKILQQGRRHEYFCYIKSGQVRVVINEERHGKEIHTIISNLGPGDIFGEFIIFNQMPAGADIITTEPTEVICIEVKSFKKFLEQDPELGYRILFDFLSTIVTRLQSTNNAVLQVMGYALDYQKKLSETIKTK